MKRPLLWYVGAWLAGCAAASLWPSLKLPLAVTLTTAALAILIWALQFRRSHCLIVPLLAVTAFGYFSWYDGRNVSSIAQLNSDPEALSGSPIVLNGTIDSPVEIDGDRVSFTMLAREAQIGEGEPMPLREKVQASVRLLKKEEQAEAAKWERTFDIRLNGVLQRPDPSRNFGGFDYRNYLRHRHIHWLVSIKGFQHVMSEPSVERFEPKRLLLLNDRLRKTLAGRMDFVFPEDQAGLMKSLLIGWQDDLDPEQYRQFSKLGLTHILAISGMNVAIFLGLLFWLLKRMRITKESSLLIGISAMPAYVLLTGASPSVVRAGLMAIIAMAAARRGLLKDGLHLTALAAWLMLLAEPYYLFDVGFQLSFLITGALLIGVPRVSRLLPFRSDKLRGTVAITAVSQLVSFPITVYYFNGFNLVSWLANLLFVPVFTLALFPGALASLALGLMYPALGHAAGSLTGWCGRLTLQAIDRMAQAGGGLQLIWPTPSVVWIALYFAGMAALYAAVARRLSPPSGDVPPAASRPASAWPIAAAAVVWATLLYYGYTPDRWSREASVEFIDVGQGDAALIRTPSRKYILIDGGGTLTFRKPGEEWRERRDPYEVGRKVLVPLLKQRGVHKLDFVIASHEDQDHIGGLQAVAEDIPIGQFLFNGTLKPDKTVIRLFQTLLDKRVPLVAAQNEPTIRVDDGTSLYLLWPHGSPSGREQPSPLRIAEKQNNESLIYLLDMQAYRWLFPGDAETPEEGGLLHRFGNNAVASPFAVDVLKVAHHGSKTSTTQQWLDFWRPHAAVISVGARNSYGHPSPQVVQRLGYARTDLFRTDWQGAIRMRITPRGIRTETALK